MVPASVTSLTRRLNSGFAVSGPTGCLGAVRGARIRITRGSAGAEAASRIELGRPDRRPRGLRGCPESGCSPGPALRTQRRLRQNAKGPRNSKCLVVGGALARRTPGLRAVPAHPTPFRATLREARLAVRRGLPALRRDSPEQCPRHRLGPRRKDGPPRRGHGRLCLAFPQSRHAGLAALCARNEAPSGLRTAERGGQRRVRPGDGRTARLGAPEPIRVNASPPK
jgi:hypothetical protein